MVEYTAEKPITQIEARRRIEELLDVGIARVREEPRWWRFSYIKVTVKEFERVIRALRRQE